MKGYELIASLLPLPISGEGNLLSSLLDKFLRISILPRAKRPGPHEQAGQEEVVKK